MHSSNIAAVGAVQEYRMHMEYDYFITLSRREPVLQWYIICFLLKYFIHLSHF